MLLLDNICLGRRLLQADPGQILTYRYPARIQWLYEPPSGLLSSQSRTFPSGKKQEQSDVIGTEPVRLPNTASQTLDRNRVRPPLAATRRRFDPSASQAGPLGAENTAGAARMHRDREEVIRKGVPGCLLLSSHASALRGN